MARIALGESTSAFCCRPLIHTAANHDNAPAASAESEVRSSSAPASLLYPTTSAARMAASFRVSAMAAPSPHARLARLLIGLDRF